MQSGIEACWTVRFGAVGAPESQMNGGVLVFETGRIFGGDSAFAYLGNYVLSGPELTGGLRIVRHNNDPAFVSLYGTNELAFDLTFTGTRTDGDTIKGRLHRQHYPDAQLILKRLAELP